MLLAFDAVYVLLEVTDAIDVYEKFAMTAVVRVLDAVEMFKIGLDVLRVMLLMSDGGSDVPLGLFCEYPLVFSAPTVVDTFEEFHMEVAVAFDMDAAGLVVVQENDVVGKIVGVVALLVVLMAVVDV